MRSPTIPSTTHRRAWLVKEARAPPWPSHASQLIIDSLWFPTHVSLDAHTHNSSSPYSNFNLNLTFFESFHGTTCPFTPISIYHLLIRLPIPDHSLFPCLIHMHGPMADKESSKA